MVGLVIGWSLEWGWGRDPSHPLGLSPQGQDVRFSGGTSVQMPRWLCVAEEPRHLRGAPTAVLAIAWAQRLNGRGRACSRLVATIWDQGVPDTKWPYAPGWKTLAPSPSISCSPCPSGSSRPLLLQIL